MLHGRTGQRNPAHTRQQLAPDHPTSNHHTHGLVHKTPGEHAMRCTSSRRRSSASNSRKRGRGAGGPRSYTARGARACAPRASDASAPPRDGGGYGGSLRSIAAFICRSALDMRKGSSTFLSSHAPSRYCRSSSWPPRYVSAAWRSAAAAATRTSSSWKIWTSPRPRLCDRRCHASAPRLRPHAD